MYVNAKYSVDVGNFAVLPYSYAVLSYLQIAEQRQRGYSKLVKIDSTFSRFQDIANAKLFVSDDEEMDVTAQALCTQQDTLARRVYWDTKLKATLQVATTANSSIADDGDDAGDEDGAVNEPTMTNQTHIIAASQYVLAHRGGQPVRRVDLTWRSKLATDALYMMEDAQEKYACESTQIKKLVGIRQRRAIATSDEDSVLTCKQAFEIMSKHEPSMYNKAAVMRSCPNWSPDDALTEYAKNHSLQQEQEHQEQNHVSRRISKKKKKCSR